MPPGRRSSTRPSASVISSDAMRFASTTSNGPSPLGALPSRDRIDPRQAVAPRVRGRGVDRDRVHVHGEHLAGPELRRRDRQDPGPGAHVEDPRRPAVRATRPEHAAVRQRLEGREAQPRRRVQPGPERHARVQREDHVVGLAAVAPPRRPDHDPPPDPQHREVRLPGVRPVRLVDDAGREVADRAQPERLEVAEVALRPGDGLDEPPRDRGSGGAPGPSPAGRGPPSPPGPPRPARTPAPRWSRRGRRATGSRTRPRPPRGRRRRRAPARRPGWRPPPRGRCPPAVRPGRRRIRLPGPRPVTGPASRAARARRPSRPSPSRTPRAARAGAWRASWGRRRWR